MLLIITGGWRVLPVWRERIAVKGKNTSSTSIPLIFRRYTCASESRCHKYRGRNHKIPTAFLSFFSRARNVHTSHIIFYASGYVKMAASVCATHHSRVYTCTSCFQVFMAHHSRWLDVPANDITESTKIAMASIEIKI